LYSYDGVMVSESEIRVDSVTLIGIFTWVQAEMRDYGQPRPYAPPFAAFAVPFFLGLGFLFLALFSLVGWWCLRREMAREEETEKGKFRV
jgi:hypothetical protein